MPDSCKKIFEQIGAPDELTTYQSSAAFGALPGNTAIRKGGIIFPRLDMEKELEALGAS